MIIQFLYCCCFFFVFSLFFVVVVEADSRKCIDEKCIDNRRIVGNERREKKPTKKTHQKTQKQNITRKKIRIDILLTAVFQLKSKMIKSYNILILVRLFELVLFCNGLSMTQDSLNNVHKRRPYRIGVIGGGAR